MAGATPDAPAVPRTAVSAIRLFALCLVASVVSSPLPLPWSVGSTVFLVVGVVAGARALVTLVRSGGRPGLVAVVSGLLALSGLLLLSEVAGLVLWPITWDYEQCRSAAITESGLEQCEKDLDDRIGSLLLPTMR